MRRRIDATWKPDGTLASPVVGVFRPALALGAAVRPGDRLGLVEVLGHDVELIAPAGTRGVIRVVAGGGKLARTPIDHGAVLYGLDPDAVVTAAATASGAITATDASAGLVFPSPTSGRYYGRPAPGKPAFVSTGDEIGEGHTICLLEVMKTFNRVTYGGPGLPPRARVTALLVADESDVDAGTPLVQLEAV